MLKKRTITPWNRGRRAATPGDRNMNDEQLRTMTEAELRARFNAAPDYLKTLLARKRVLEEETLWEVNLRPRHTSPGNDPRP